MNLRPHVHRSALTAAHTAAWVTLLVLVGCQESSGPDVSTPSPAAVVPASAAKETDAPGDTPISANDASVTKKDPVPAIATAAAPKPAVPNQIKNVSFDDIKFEMEKGTTFQRSMLTETIEAYAGRSIRLRGFIFPSFQQDGIKQFVLVRDNQECCFGPGAALFDCVMVRMVPGKTASFSVRPVTVEGEFGIEEWKDFEGAVRAIYHLKGTSVQ